MTAGSDNVFPKIITAVQSTDIAAAIGRLVEALQQAGRRLRPVIERHRRAVRRGFGRFLRQR